MASSVTHGAKEHITAQNTTLGIASVNTHSMPLLQKKLFCYSSHRQSVLLADVVDAWRLNFEFRFRKLYIASLYYVKDIVVSNKNRIFVHNLGIATDGKYK
jgi:hypothetical protein